MSRSGVGRGGRITGLVLTWCVASLLIASPVAANCQPDVTGRVSAPTEVPIGGDKGAPCHPTPGSCIALPGIGGTWIEVPESWWHKEFVLTSGPIPACVGCIPTNPLGVSPDFAIRLYDADGELLIVHDTPYEERGNVTPGAASARVTYWGPSLDQHFQIYVDCPKV